MITTRGVDLFDRVLDTSLSVKVEFEAKLISEPGGFI